MRSSVRFVPLLILVAALVYSCTRSDEQQTESYAPQIEPSQFSATVDNAFFPLARGTTFLYETPDGAERVEVIVTGETREILGVECVIVESREYEDGELAEVTRDWYAQDASGSVWYFGEDTVAYAEDGSETPAGSWEAGADGAQPGIIMPGSPVIGEPYRQEYYAGHAEDMGQVERLDGVVEVPYGSFEGALVTKEWTPLEPGVSEHKYYVGGVGLVLEDEGSVRVELVEVSKEAVR